MATIKYKIKKTKMGKFGDPNSKATEYWQSSKVTTNDPDQHMKKLKQLEKAGSVKDIQLTEGKEYKDFIKEANSVLDR